MAVKAKFTVKSVTAAELTGPPSEGQDYPPIPGFAVHIATEYGDRAPGEDLEDEDALYGHATPQADLRMTVTEPAGRWFAERIGKPVYATFTDD